MTVAGIIILVEGVFQLAIIADLFVYLGSVGLVWPSMFLLGMAKPLTYDNGLPPMAVSYLIVLFSVTCLLSLVGGFYALKGKNQGLTYIGAFTSFFAPLFGVPFASRMHVYEAVWIAFAAFGMTNMALMALLDAESRQSEATSLKSRIRIPALAALLDCIGGAALIVVGIYFSWFPPVRMAQNRAK